MSKIICDICGTTYQETADCCPICGCSRGDAAAMLGDDLLIEEIVEEPKGRSGRFSSKKRKEIFDYDEVNDLQQEPEEDEEYPYDDEEEYEEEPRHNAFLVILLTILISILLIAAAFVFVRFYLPNRNPAEETTPQTVAQTWPVPLESTEPAVPCTGLALTSGTASGKAELTKAGQFFLLHVTASPENTTDKIVYTSADESIATVTEDGRITAVSEGTTKIYITCGSIQLDCEVVCSFAEETVPTEQTQDETLGENETVPGNAPDANVQLKLEKTDIKLGVGYYVTLKLDCGLEQNQVEWISEHPHIASVDENGVVRALKSGTTSITAKYGDQTVSCIVRCG